jgi:hypothetical protein
MKIPKNSRLRKRFDKWFRGFVAWTKWWLVCHQPKKFEKHWTRWQNPYINYNNFCNPGTVVLYS